jgi:hypothetical protein
MTNVFAAVVTVTFDSCRRQAFYHSLPAAEKTLGELPDHSYLLSIQDNRKTGLYQRRKSRVVAIRLLGLLIIVPSKLSGFNWWL